MSDTSKIIKIISSEIERPDCIELVATLHIVRVGFVSKEGPSRGKDIDRMIRQLTHEVLEIVYSDVLTKLDNMCQELLSNASQKSFDVYNANLEMAQKLRIMATKLRNG